ncbi:hypothetical protein WT98_06170 [Burkholderia territorii]|nr:hypothetical protein WT98_06170 [Burkholderia territorii]
MHDGAVQIEPVRGFEAIAGREFDVDARGRPDFMGGHVQIAVRRQVRVEIVVAVAGWGFDDAGSTGTPPPVG